MGDYDTDPAGSYPTVLAELDGRAIVSLIANGHQRELWSVDEEGHAEFLVSGATFHFTQHEGLLYFLVPLSPRTQSTSTSCTSPTPRHAARSSSRGATSTTCT